MPVCRTGSPQRTKQHAALLALGAARDCAAALPTAATCCHTTNYHPLLALHT